MFSRNDYYFKDDVFVVIGGTRLLRSNLFQPPSDKKVFFIYVYFTFNQIHIPVKNSKKNRVFHETKVLRIIEYLKNHERGFSS